MLRHLQIVTISVIIFLTASLGVHGNDWWYEDGKTCNYRVMTEITLRNGAEATDFPVSCNINFGELLASVSVSADVNISSIRVVDPEIPGGKVIGSVFIPKEGSINEGLLCWKADSLNSGSAKVYHVYFDTKDVGLSVQGIPEFGIYFEAEDFANRSAFVKAKGTLGGALPGASFAPGSEEKYVYAGPAGENGVNYTGSLMQKYSGESLLLPSGRYNFHVRFSSYPEQSHTFIVKPEIASGKYGAELNKTVTGGAEKTWKWETLGGLDLEQGEYGFYWSFKNLEKQLSVDLVLITNYDFTPTGNNFCNHNTIIGEVEQEKHHISKWLTIGTFPSSSFNDNLFEPTEIVPYENENAQGQYWQLSPVGADGNLSFEGDAGLAYAHVYIKSANEYPLSLDIKSTDSIAVYLNGEKKHEHIGEDLQPGAGVNITLRTGWNRLLVKVEKTSEQSKFYLGLYNQFGNFPGDLVFAESDPESLHLLSPNINTLKFSPYGTKKDVLITFGFSVPAFSTVRVIRKVDNSEIFNLIQNEQVDARPISISWDGKAEDDQFVQEGEYLIKIEAVRQDNPNINVSHEFLVTFVTNLPPVNSPKLISPLNNSIFTTSTPIYKWESVPEAEGYIFELSRTAQFDENDILLRKELMKNETFYDGEGALNRYEFDEDKFSLAGDATRVDDLKASNGKAAMMKSTTGWNIRLFFTDITSGVYSGAVVARSDKIQEVNVGIYDPVQKKNILSKRFLLGKDYEILDLGNVELTEEMNLFIAAVEADLNSHIYVDKVILGRDLSYYWRVGAYDEFGSVAVSEIRKITFTSPVRNAAVENLICAPNPFAPARDERLTIAFSNGEGALVSAQIYNLEGRVVKEIFSAEKVPNSGEQELSWDGNDNNGRPLGTGLYFVVVSSKDLVGGKTSVRRLPVVIIR